MRTLAALNYFPRFQEQDLSQGYVPFWDTDIPGLVDVREEVQLPCLNSKQLWPS
jgi:hypothetical protein